MERKLLSILCHIGEDRIKVAPIGDHNAYKTINEALANKLKLYKTENADSEELAENQFDLSDEVLDEQDISDEQDELKVYKISNVSNYDESFNGEMNENDARQYIAKYLKKEGSCFVMIDDSTDWQRHISYNKFLVLEDGVEKFRVWESKSGKKILEQKFTFTETNKGINLFLKDIKKDQRIIFFPIM